MLSESTRSNVSARQAIACSSCYARMESVPPHPLSSITALTTSHRVLPYCRTMTTYQSSAVFTVCNRQPSHPFPHPMPRPTPTPPRGTLNLCQRGERICSSFRNCPRQSLQPLQPLQPIPGAFYGSCTMQDVCISLHGPPSPLPSPASCSP